MIFEVDLCFGFNVLFCNTQQDCVLAVGLY
jgi:hypothetical protein